MYPIDRPRTQGNLRGTKEAQEFTQSGSGPFLERIKPTVAGGTECFALHSSLAPSDPFSVGVSQVIGVALSWNMTSSSHAWTISHPSHPWNTTCGSPDMTPPYHIHGH